MDVQDYLKDGERILKDVTIHEDPYALFTSGKAGTLACTENRLVYAEGKNVLDVSLNRVDSFEYQAPEMPKAYLNVGIGSFIFALLSLMYIPDVFLLAIIVGAVLLLVGYWLRTSVLVIHTPSTWHQFQSRDDDLVKIAHVLRDREMGSESE